MSDLYAGARGDERFFLSRWCPRMLVHLNVGLAKVTLWGPYPFISVAFGWFFNRGRKVHALQMYFGVKCDGSRTKAFNGTDNEDLIWHWVMVLTFKEWAAFRIRWINYNQTWDNQAGA